MTEIQVKEIAFGQAGDKGDKSNVFVIPYRESDYELLADRLTEQRVYDLYADIIEGTVTRHLFPGIKAINFVMTEALGGGVSSNLNIDPHGKNRAGLLLAEEISVPDNYEPPATVDGAKEWIRTHE